MKLYYTMNIILFILVLLLIAIYFYSRKMYFYVLKKFMKTIISAFATFERAQIRSRTKQTLRMKKEAGFRVSGYAPYGYDFTDDKKRVVENEEEQKVLSLIKEMKDAGEGAAAVKKELNKRGIKTKQGKSTWHYQSVYKIYQKVDFLTYFTNFFRF